MKKIFLMAAFVLLVGLSCTLPVESSQDMDSTQVALAIQQTSLVLDQTRVNQAEAPTVTPEPAVQPTYTPYPTYTIEVVEATTEPTVQEPTVAIEQPTEQEPTEEETEPVVSFEDWLKDVNILLYTDMDGAGGTQVVEKAIDGLRLAKNTKNVKSAMGRFMEDMNSAVDWDLIIIAAESRSRISGEYFDLVADQMDRGSSLIIEIWYIDQIHFGRIQPVMQRCGIDFHRDWFRDSNSSTSLAGYVVYLLEPSHPIFSQPNTISMLRPYDVMWIADVGDLLKINTGSNAVLLAGSQAREHNSYGLIAECMDGRMIWQTFSTHDYRYQEMINLWSNYIYNTLQARYEYLQQ